MFQLKQKQQQQQKQKHQQQQDSPATQQNVADNEKPRKKVSLGWPFVRPSIDTTSMRGWRWVVLVSPNYVRFFFFFINPSYPHGKRPPQIQRP